MSRIAERIRSIGPAGLLPLGVLFGLNAVDELDRFAFGALGPEIRDAFDLSNESFIFIVSLSIALPILLAVPVGYLADRGDRVRLSRTGALVWARAALLTGLAPTVGVLVLARFLGGAGRVVNEPVHPSLLADWYPPGQLPWVFAAHRFANTVGALGGPLAGVLAVVIGGWRPVFVLFAVPSLVLVAVSLRLRDPTRDAGRTADAVAAPDEERVPFRDGFRELRSVRSLRRTWLAAFLFGSGVLPFAGFLGLFFEDVYNVGPVGRGGVQFMFAVGGAIGLAIGGRLAARVASSRPERLPVVIGLLIVEFGVAVLLCGIAPWLGLSLALVAVIGIGATGYLPAYLTMVALLAPPRLRSQAYSYSLLFFALGGVSLSRIAAGVGGDGADGLRASFVLLGCFVMAGGLVETTVRAFVRRDIEQATSAGAARAAGESGAILVCRDVSVAYGQVQVLFGVDFEVTEGEIVALLGTNGAGKSTLLKAISGVVDPIGGVIAFDGAEITHAGPNATAAAGIAQVPGGRGIFPTLTVAENLRVAGWLFRKDPEYRKEAVERVLEHFPILRTRWDTQAGSLSGGEQQMLSLAQAFIAKPKLLLIDELSLGLAPTVVDRLLDIVRAIHANGTTVVLVEQSVNTALRLAERAVFMEKGEVRFAGPTRELLERPDILRAVFLQGAAAVTGSSNGKARPAVDRRARAESLREQPIVLETVSLTKRYGGITAVRDVDLQVHQGEILGLIGPNGAGKTTIFDLISGLAPHDGGRVLLHGSDVSELAAWARARAGLGRSFQDARLWGSLTVAEALAVACERHVEVRATFPALLGVHSVAASEASVRSRVADLIALMGLGAFEDKFLSELSTGSRRMVEIAAILAHRPSVLILDEPSSGIAQKETEALGPLLLQVRDHLACSMLVIEHDMPLITGLADRIVALEQGAVIASGSPEDVVRHPRVVESYLGSIAEDLQAASGPGPLDVAAAVAVAGSPAPSRRREQPLVARSRR